MLEIIEYFIATFIAFMLLDLIWLKRKNLTKIKHGKNINSALVFLAILALIVSNFYLSVFVLILIICFCVKIYLFSNKLKNPAKKPEDDLS